MKTSLILRLSTLGLFTAAAAWMVHQQTGYVLAAYACGKHAAWFWLVNVVAILVLVSAALLSSRRSHQDKAAASTDAEPRQFMRWLGVTGACVFGFAVVMQAAAAAILPSCTP